jgi:hypothetical protein
MTTVNVGDSLKELLELFTSQLLEEVRVAKNEGIPIAAADKAAIIRFLQINNAIYQPGQSDELDKLRDMLKQKAVDKNKNALDILREADKEMEALYTGNTMQ